MKTVRPVREPSGEPSYPSLEQEWVTRRGFNKKFFGSLAGLALAAPAAARARLPGEAPAPRIHRVVFDPGSTQQICDQRFRRLLIETPDPPVAAAVKKSCHRAGILKAIVRVRRQFANCAYLRGARASREIERALGAQLRAYFRSHASGPISPLKVTLFQVPPPPPRGDDDRPRLLGVPKRPRGPLGPGGCASCDTSGSGTDSKGADDGVGLGWSGAAALLLGWCWRRRRSGDGSGVGSADNGG